MTGRSAPAGPPAGPTVDASVTMGVGSLDALGSRARDLAPAFRYVVVTDDLVGPLYAERAVAALRAGGPPGALVDVLTIPAGESSKTRATWAALTDRLVALGCGRDTTLVALGGGVVGDLAGFVAATYMRGIPLIQVPTTLLAMIDAAIGGKTGVDTPAGKNLVGAFHPAAAVVIDPGVLETLPRRQLSAGLAEALKHGVVADAAYFTSVAAALPAILGPGGATSDAMETLVAGSIAIKAGIVAADERERGLRKVLNFGHTIGHAVEAVSGYTLLHGEAVAIGMAVECRLAELAAVAECGITGQVAAALDAAGLPTDPPAGMSADAIVSRTHADKKARAGAVEYALPRAVGEMAGADTGWGTPLPDAFVLEALR